MPCNMEGESPHLGGLLESERPWMVLGTPFIQLLEYYFSTLQFCHLYFYLFKNLWGLLVTPDCAVQSTSSLCPSEVCCSLKYAEAHPCSNTPY